MATNATPVTAAEKDQPGVIETKTFVQGVGDLSVYVKVEKVDDVDSKTTEDVQTLTFAVPVEDKDDDGETFFKTVHYEVDLGAASREKLAKALAPFTKNAREVVPSVSRPSAGTSKSPHDLNAIREWAKSAGHEVADKGRIATKVITAYYKNTGKQNPDEA